MWFAGRGWLLRLALGTGGELGRCGVDAGCDQDAPLRIEARVGRLLVSAFDYVELSAPF